jgi:hypothetical protein
MADPVTPLATNDPNAWTPTGASPTPMDVNPATMGQGQVPNLPAAAQPTVTQGPDPNAFVPTTTNVTSDPELHAAAVHHSRLANALNAVADILGGNKTLNLVRNPDGSVDVTQKDATTGEKWGRIAQAALSGAAKGFAVGQGPGGTARAASTGILSGLAMPQQQIDQTTAMAQKYNDQNKQAQLLKANIAYMNQQNLASSWELENHKHLAGEHDEDREAQFNAFKTQAHLIPVGPAASIEDAAKTYNSNQQVQQAVTSGQLYIHHPSSGPPTAWIIPEDQMNKLNPNPAVGYNYSLSDDQQKIVKTPYDIAANSETGAQKNARLANENKQLLENVSGLSKAQDAQAQAEQRRQQVQNAPLEQQRIQAQIRASNAEAGLHGAQERMLTATGADSPYAGLGQDIYEGRADISQLRTRKDWPQVYAAARQYGIENGLPPLNISDATARFKAKQDTVRDYSGNGAAAQKIQGFSTLLAHTADVVDNANALQQTGSPYLNKPINELEKDVLGGTRVGPAEMRTRVTSSEFGNVLSNNRALNNEEKENAQKSLNAAQTPAQQRENSKQIIHTAIDRLAPVFQAFREASGGQESPTQLTPRAVQALRNVGLYDYAMQQLHPAQATGGGGQQPPATGQSNNPAGGFNWNAFPTHPATR